MEYENVMRYLAGKIPRYGNWGGPWHDGFERNKDGTIKWEGNNPVVDPNKLPIDDLDACFMRHDLVYVDKTASPLDIMKADLQLLWWEVMALDTDSATYPKDPYAQAYIAGVKTVFAGKLTYDVIAHVTIESYLRLTACYPSHWVDPLWDFHKVIDDTSLFSPKSPGELIPTSSPALALEQWMDTHYPGVPRYIFPSIEACIRGGFNKEEVIQ